MGERWIRVLFVAAALYDLVLGLVVLVFPIQLFEYFQVELPNHMAYVRFPALLVLLFAVMFFRISEDPVGRRELIYYGCGLKLSYCAVIFWYQIKYGVPAMWLPWAWADAVFLVLFVMALRSLPATPSAPAVSPGEVPPQAT